MLQTQHLSIFFYLDILTFKWFFFFHCQLQISIKQQLMILSNLTHSPRVNTWAFYNQKQGLHSSLTCRIGSMFQMTEMDMGPFFPFFFWCVSNYPDFLLPLLCLICMRLSSLLFINERGIILPKTKIKTKFFFINVKIVFTCH